MDMPTSLTKEEFAALRSLNGLAIKRAISPKIQARLVSLGLAKDIMGSIALTDAGHLRVVMGMVGNKLTD
jgi:hypothetical protein